jgi:hypothetical protein
MEFGLLKSKIEKKLADSYLNESFKKEIANFKKIVLSNESLSKAFHIYNELNDNKNYSDRFAEDFLEECIDLYNRLEVDEKSFFLLEKWVSDVKTENNYTVIDKVLNKGSVLIEDRIKSKTIIIEKLKKPKIKKETINISLSEMVNVANQNLEKYLSELNESDLNMIKKYKSLNESDLKKRYEVISEIVIEKLDQIQKNSNEEIKGKINETINKIKSQDINPLNLVKLISLNETL